MLTSHPVPSVIGRSAIGRRPRCLAILPRILCGATAAVLCVSLVEAQPNPGGHWEGTFSADGRTVSLGLDLARNAKGEWIASMSIPSEQATGLVVSDVVVDGTSVTFVAVELMMARFDLILGADGRLKGTLSNGRTTAPVEFTRTGEAKVELIAPSPAVSKDFEGDWEGSLGMGNQTMMIVFHFQNQADGTVAATMQNVTMGAMRFPLNDVKQDGRTVAFGMKIAHSTFRGTLNSEGTQLSGQLTHEDTSIPLTLVKK